MTIKKKLYKRLTEDCSYKHLNLSSLLMNEGTYFYVLKDLPEEGKVVVYDDKGFIFSYVDRENIDTTDEDYKFIVEFDKAYFQQTTTDNVYEEGEKEEDTLIPFLSNSGGKVSYYSVHIKDPISDDLMPYVVEFEDIALALGLTPMEYNIMKDIWRNANNRTNGIGKDGNTQLRTYQKVAHYGNILLKLEERK